MLKVERTVYFQTCRRIKTKTPFAPIFYDSCKSDLSINNHFSTNLYSLFMKDNSELQYVSLLSQQEMMQQLNSQCKMTVLVVLLTLI